MSAGNRSQTVFGVGDPNARLVFFGEGPGARSIKLDLPPFTLVGATTRAGLLTSPLRDRFGIVQRLEFYSRDDLGAIANRSANILNLPIEEQGADEIAKRARGTPRIANRLLRRVRDFAEVKGGGFITGTVADDAMGMLYDAQKASSPILVTAGQHDLTENIIRPKHDQYLFVPFRQHAGNLHRSLLDQALGCLPDPHVDRGVVVGGQT